MIRVNGRTFHFQEIRIQSKDDSEDFRAFCRCLDHIGRVWELKGNGNTAGEAAQEVWEMFLDPRNWDSYGYMVKGNNKRKNRRKNRRKR